METIADGKIRIWAPIHEVESEALTQLKNIAALPWVFHHVAAMPDVHFGRGATVGSVIAMKGAVSPAAVGVDIGCGMGAVKLGLKATDLPNSLKDIRNKFEDSIPVGFNQHDEHQNVGKSGLSQELRNEFNKLFSEFKDLHNGVHGLLGKAMRQCGTLGGGNHFIELCLDTEDNVWIMLHSGSRNIGKSLAEYHIGIAKKLSHNTVIPDRDLSVFLAGTKEMEEYRRDLFWAQRYAMLNRKVMMALALKGMEKFFPNDKLNALEQVWCHHNYVAEEVHYGEEVLVTRKGAIEARKGVMGIIPGSMGTASFIVRGLGNPEAFESASHGAGRRMSRSKAKKSFTVNDLEEQTKGIECRKDSGVLDEIPGSYKDIMKVMDNQKDLVEIVTQLRQVLCVKG